MTTIANVSKMLNDTIGRLPGVQAVNTYADFAYVTLPDNLVGIRKVHANGKHMPSWAVFHETPNGIVGLGSFNRVRDAVDAAAYRVKETGH